MIQKGGPHRLSSSGLRRGPNTRPTWKRAMGWCSSLCCTYFGGIDEPKDIAVIRSKMPNILCVSRMDFHGSSCAFLVLDRYQDCFGNNRPQMPCFSRSALIHIMTIEVTDRDPVLFLKIALRTAISLNDYHPNRKTRGMDLEFESPPLPV